MKTKLINKKQLLNQISILERQRFLDVYNEFERWLMRMNYRPAKYTESDMTDNNIMVSKIDNLYGVEHYVLDSLGMNLFFIRERNKHLFYFVHGFNHYSLPHTIEEFKAQIFKDTDANKKAKLDLLSKIPNTI